jgi:putative restriction endonuclease
MRFDVLVPGARDRGGEPGGWGGLGECRRCYLGGCQPTEAGLHCPTNARRSRDRNEDCPSTDQSSVASCIGNFRVYNLDMYSAEEQALIREDIFRWLDDRIGRGRYEFKRAELFSYSWHGVSLPLVDSGRGIRNPQMFSSTLSIMTTLKSPYGGEDGDQPFIDYHYRAGSEADNRKLRAAHDRHDPLIYFREVRPTYYAAFYPVFVVKDNPEDETFTIALDESFTFFGDPLKMTGDQRRYAEKLVRTRLHQPVFRARVMHAYRSTCAICELRHPDLLDAAHIIPDSLEGGFADVTNGLALCKIHHAAYDRNLLGITPNYEVRINQSLLDEVDGPMLRHGLQDMHGRFLSLPKRVVDRPSASALATRYEQFAA